MSNSKNSLEKAFETIHKMIINKKMELNIEKCEYITVDDEENFIEP